MAADIETGELTPNPDWKKLDNVGGPFLELAGPVFSTAVGLRDDEPIRYGLRILKHHCNMRMVCHGGMLATFMDFSLARGATEGLMIRTGTPTMNLSLDYLSPASLGDWIETRVSILRRSKRTAFMQAILLGPECPVMRGSAIYKLPNQDGSS